MTKIVPPAPPELPVELARRLLGEANVLEGVALIGRRGYYRDTMGTVGENDRGIYDDAIALLTPTAYVTFNANCDPSIKRQGVANLKAGVWRYKVGTHNLSKEKKFQYTALVQAAPVTVLRDNQGDDTGYFGINIHRGGYNTTSSLGCQTIYPDQWDSFINLVKGEMLRHSIKTIPYLLTER